LERRPKIHGSAADLRISNELRTVLDSAEKEMSKLKDEFTSAEHYLLALAGANVPAAKLLKDSGRHAGQADAGASASARLAAGDRSKSRGQNFRRWKNTGATSRNWRGAGKIDPVIGRDNEIRRVMQVLFAPNKE